MSLKRGRDDYIEPGPNNTSGDSQIFESSAVEDRASKFIGLFSPVVSAKELQAHLPFRKASHRILAWRKPSTQQSLTKFKAAGGSSTIYTTGFDDDGEKYAGKKLEKLLIDLDIEGAIVVARWYGGVLLGPVRFAHIEQVARDAINKWRSSFDQAAALKKQKTDSTATLSPAEEAERKTKLTTVLANRDNSIKVLRELFAEKKTATSSTASSSDTKVPQSSASIPSANTDYSLLPLSKLLQLEKARDTTISWILKQIDNMETKAGVGKDSTGSRPEDEQTIPLQPPS